MRQYPPFRTPEEPGQVLDSGHLWVLEYVTGPILGFSMDESGLVSFSLGGEELTDVPPSVKRAVTHVRDRIDREGLRDGVEDVANIVFYGIATRNEGINYDWDALEPFLGIDIWVDHEDRFVTPDVNERVFDAIGLSPVPAFEKELPADHFDVSAYDHPDSHWRDGGAVGVIVRNKSGGKVLVENDAVDLAPSTERADDEIVRERVAETFRRELQRLNGTVNSVDTAVLEARIFDRLTRVCYAELADRLERDPDSVRDIVAAEVRAAVQERRT